MKISTRILAAIVLPAAFYGSYSFVSSIIDREPPIVYEAANALAPSVESGGTIEVQFKVFRKRICDQIVKRFLTDSTGTKHSIPSYTVGIQMLAGRETYQRSITVPTAAVVGPASYQVIIDYACNALQRMSGFPIEVVSPPITFDIITPVDVPKVEPVGPDG
jgi:hypothetical protein